MVAYFFLELPFDLVAFVVYCILFLASTHIIANRRVLYDEPLSEVAVHVYILTMFYGLVRVGGISVSLMFAWHDRNAANKIPWMLDSIFMSLGSSLFFTLFVYHLWTWIGIVITRSDEPILPSGTLRCIKLISCALTLWGFNALRITSVTFHSKRLSLDLIQAFSASILAFVIAIGYVIYSKKLIAILSASTIEDKKQRVRTVRRSMSVFAICMIMRQGVPLAYILNYIGVAHIANLVPVYYVFVYVPETVAIAAIMYKFSPLRANQGGTVVSAGVSLKVFRVHSSTTPGSVHVVTGKQNCYWFAHIRKSSL